MADDADAPNEATASQAQTENSDDIIDIFGDDEPSGAQAEPSVAPAVSEGQTQPTATDDDSDKEEFTGLFDDGDEASTAPQTTSKKETTSDQTAAKNVPCEHRRGRGERRSAARQGRSREGRSGKGRRRKRGTADNPLVFRGGATTELEERRIYRQMGKLGLKSACSISISRKLRASQYSNVSEQKRVRTIPSRFRSLQRRQTEPSIR